MAKGPLGDGVGRSGGSKSTYTPEQDSRILASTPEGYDELALEFGRTRNAIKNRRRYLTSRQAEYSSPMKDALR